MSTYKVVVPGIQLSVSQSVKISFGEKEKLSLSILVTTCPGA